MLKTYVLNLDRHSDRMQCMRSQLERTNLDWQRFSGIDALAVDSEFLDKLVANRGPIPRMPIGARACTAGHFLILKDFIASEATHALILEDDVLLAWNLATLLPDIVESYGGGILNISRQIPSGNTKKLIVRRGDLQRNGFHFPELVSIHYSGAGYLVDKDAAKTVLELFKIPDMPIDHILFNPNVSKIRKHVSVRQLFPALVQPRTNLVSSIQTLPVAGSNSLKNRIKRAKAEISIVPRLLVGLALGRYQVLQLDCVEPEE